VIRELTESLLKACEEAIEYKIYGTSRDHVESIERLPDEDGAFKFRITTWNEISENSRKVRDLSLIETMDILAGYIAERATRVAAERMHK